MAQENYSRLNLTAHHFIKIYYYTKFKNNILETTPK
jgi:hypothetical protein